MERVAPRVLYAELGVRVDLEYVLICIVVGGSYTSLEWERMGEVGKWEKRLICEGIEKELTES